MLSVRTGCMFSRKTTWLTQKISHHADIQDTCKCVIINSKIDNRDLDNIISSHSSLYKGLSSKVDVISLETLLDFDITKYDVIGIDESQFFPDLFDAVKKWISLDKYIYVVGLDSDSNGDKFGKISELVHISDEFEKLRSYCNICSKNIKGIFTPDNMILAPFTAKISNKNGNIIDIGDTDKYLPVCRKHHRESLIK